MTRDNPYPNARHRTEDWDPAGTSEEEKKDGPETEPSETSDPVPDRPGDPKPAEIAGFEPNDRTSAGGAVERERQPDSQSNC